MEISYNMTAFDDMIDYAHQITLKWHMLIGFIVGAGPLSFVMNHWEDGVLALLVGFFTSIGAGLGKLIVERLRKRGEKEIKKTKKPS